MHEFQGSLIGTRYPEPGSDNLYKHFVDINGSTVYGISLDKIAEILAVGQ